MTASIVVFGATGYTGRLTVGALVRQGARPVLAGRSRSRLDEVAAEVGGGLETRLADVDDPESLRALLQAGDVLVTTVGPFLRRGRPARSPARARSWIRCTISAISSGAIRSSSPSWTSSAG